jgi:hypothetical protein
MSRNASTLSSSYTLCAGICPSMIFLKMVSAMASSCVRRGAHFHLLRSAAPVLFGAARAGR